ncbi:SRPBCC family protein [Tsukamurella tyrosinosolvens]|uniref:SRPBCC family protein n=1 Tax=Tsukamurella tyrosinosolvens TaxID=57704 RepID=UPI003F4A12A8
MTNAEQDLSDTVTINASRDHVWSILADPHTMPAASPELFAITRIRRGPLHAGETFIGWNRRKAVIWPTVNHVTIADPGERLTWHTRTSGATWTYTIDDKDGMITVREQRQMPSGAPLPVRLFASLLLGGMSQHSSELAGHMSRTLQWIKATAEQ